MSEAYLNRLKGGTLKHVVKDLELMRQVSLSVDDAQTRINLVEIIDRLLATFALVGPGNMGCMGVLQNVVRREIASFAEDAATKQRSEYKFSLKPEDKDRYHGQLVKGTAILDELAASLDGVVPVEWQVMAGLNQAKNLSAGLMMGFIPESKTGYEE